MKNTHHETAAAGSGSHTEQSQNQPRSLDSVLDGNALEQARVRVNKQAYLLWEQAGSPMDRNPADFWLQAEQEFLTQEGQPQAHTMSASANSAE